MTPPDVWKPCGALGAALGVLSTLGAVVLDGVALGARGTAVLDGRSPRGALDGRRD